MDSVDFYRSFHTHPVNKLIHVFCIPLIVLTTINFLSKLSLQFKLPLRKYRIDFMYKPHTKQIMYRTFYINCYVITSLYNIYYYVFWSFKIGFIMQLYIGFLYILGEIWRDFDKKWLKHSIITFVCAWMLQFLGHAIEGNRPALLTSLSQTIFQAPLLTLEYVYPNLLN